MSEKFKLPTDAELERLRVTAKICRCNHCETVLRMFAVIDRLRERCGDAVDDVAYMTGHHGSKPEERASR